MAITRSQKIGVCALSLLSAGVGGFLFSRFAPAGGTAPERREFRVVRETGKEFQFIAPLLAVGDDPTLRLFPQLEKDISELIGEKERSGLAENVSVYFKDFQSSQWAGVNEDDKYSPASMYKVALLIAVLKEAETNPQLLATDVVYQGKSPLLFGDESNSLPDPIVKGKSYPVPDLLRRMIVYSDNNAKDLLLRAVDQDILKETFTDLGVVLPDEQTTGDINSVKSFSIFFRVLYNASYLNREYSEAALSLLSGTKFSDGLAVGVPDDIVVAHKFGYRGPPDAATHELHDCGIIYYPSHPYMLCVMTRGKKFEDLSKVIQDISRAVYNERVKNPPS